MKYQDFETFERALARGLASVYGIVSGDVFERERAVRSLQRVLLAGVKRPELCVRVFEAARAGALLEELEGVSLLADRGVVIVNDADKLAKKSVEALVGYCANPNVSVCLVLVGETLVSRLYKQVEKVGVVLHIPEEKAWQKEKKLVAALVRRAREAGKSVDVAVCQRIVESVGVDGIAAEQELEKIICYVGDKASIDAADVGAVCSLGGVATVWQLGEAIFQRNAFEALRVARGMLAAGESPVALVAQLRRQVQKEYQVCCILAGGGGPQGVTEAFGYMRGRVLQQHVQMAQSYGLQRFKKALVAVDDTALSLRNSAADPALLIEVLLTRLVA